MTKSLITEYRLELSCFLSLLFGFLTIIGVVGALLAEEDNAGNVTYRLPDFLSFLGDLAQPFGTWATWLVVAAPIGLVICVWWFYDFVKKTRELAELMDTPSKAKFVRNLDDIEYLGWSLPRRYERKVIEKKKEFKL